MDISVDVNAQRAVRPTVRSLLVSIGNDTDPAARDLLTLTDLQTLFERGDQAEIAAVVVLLLRVADQSLYAAARLRLEAGTADGDASELSRVMIDELLDALLKDRG